MAFLCCLPFILFFTALVAAVPVSQASTASATSLAADIMGIIDYAVWSAEDTWNNCDLTQARMPIGMVRTCLILVSPAKLSQLQLPFHLPPPD